MEEKLLEKDMIEQPIEGAVEEPIPAKAEVPSEAPAAAAAEVPAEAKTEAPIEAKAEEPDVPAEESAAEEPVIELKHVTKKYKLYKNERDRFMSLFSKKKRYTEKVAVRDLTFKINRGEGVALIGRNGAGKSTILKMITGVSYPTEGEITINGRVSALLELSAGFIPDFTGRENIYLKGSLMGLNDKEIKEIEAAIIEFAELNEYIDQPVRTYSSGMRARLGFSINVNIDPEILIVDEALSVGDRVFKKKCTKRIQEIMDQKEITLLFVTHSLKQAKSFCNRGIVLRKGRLRFDGPIDDAINYYEKKTK